MSSAAETRVRAPGFVRLVDPLIKRLLGAGVGMGPNALLTVRGRKSSLPRTTPVALIELDGRRWIQSPFGEVNWVRNLRTSGEATLGAGRRTEPVTASELSAEEALAFYRDVLATIYRQIPAPVRMTLGPLLGFSAVLKDPAKAARERPVFELRTAPA